MKFLLLTLCYFKMTEVHTSTVLQNCIALFYTIYTIYYYLSQKHNNNINIYGQLLLEVPLNYFLNDAILERNRNFNSFLGKYWRLRFDWIYVCDSWYCAQEKAGKTPKVTKYLHISVTFDKMTVEFDAKITIDALPMW